MGRWYKSEQTKPRRSIRRASASAQASRPAHAVLDVAANEGIPARLGALTVDDLSAADEVFLTGTAAELQAVGEIDDHKIGVGPITLAMKAAYAELVRK